MKEFIFYTTEGYTYPPTEGEDVENCQVLGIVCGENMKDARNHLEEKYPWIKECGFNINEAICKELVSNDIRSTLKQNNDVIEYLINLLDRRQFDKFNEWLLNRIE